MAPVDRSTDAPMVLRVDCTSLADGAMTVHVDMTSSSGVHYRLRAGNKLELSLFGAPHGLPPGGI